MSFRGPNPGLSRSSLAPGTQLNRTYEIGDLISSGGMGEVYRGHNIATGDPVAIKVVLPEYAADQLILDLFRKEARILYQLAHDAIVRYYGFAIDPDINRAFMAMEFVEGPSLADQMRQGPLAVADVAGLKTRLADGLQRAHELGIIHRDISPENVILQGGVVARAKIIDFGIAKSTALASEGTLIGTTFAGRYNYASPEQVGMFRPQTVSPRSDIYSLGLVIAAALRGTPIDMSGTMAEIMEKRMAVPDLSDIPEEMRELLTAMLQPNPELRIPSMADVRDWAIDGPDGKPLQVRRSSPAPMPLKVEPTQPAAPRISSKRPVLRPSSKSPPKPQPTRPTVKSRESESGSRTGLWIGLGVAAVIALGAGGGFYYVSTLIPILKAPTVEAYNGEQSPDHISGTWAEGAAKSLTVAVANTPIKATLGSDAALVSDGKGNWRLALNQKLPPGEYDVVVDIADDTGLAARDETSSEIRIGAAPPPPPPPTPEMKAPTVEAPSGTENPGTISGTWDEKVAKSLVVSITDTPVKATLGTDKILVSDGSGNWTLTLPQRLAPGDYDVVAETADAGGKTARDSTKDELKIAKPGTGPAVTVKPNSVKTPVEMTDFIASYNGGECFFAWPRELKLGAAKISVFAFSKDSFEGFYESFKTASGFDPVINVHKISEAQCAAVDAIKQLARSKTPVPTLALVQSKIPAGGVLMGEMKDIFPGKKLEILHVNESGETFRLTGLANGGTFTAKVGQASSVAAGADPLPQLAIVLSSPKPLQSLSKLDDRASQPASSVFPAVMTEAESIGKVSAAVQYFVLDAP